MPPTLLILDHALDHQLYRPVEHWSKALGLRCDQLHVPSASGLPSPGVHSHVILTGSEASILQRASWTEAEMTWVRLAVEQGVHLLGSCWGHQLIAAALGGLACVRASATPEFGWRRIEVQDTGCLLPEDEFWAFTSHFDEVVPESHPDLHCLASTLDCAVQAFRWGTLPVWGIQAHPEIDAETGRSFLAQAQQTWPAKAVLFAQALTEPMQDSGMAPELLRRFLSQS